MKAISRLFAKDKIDFLWLPWLLLLGFSLVYDGLYLLFFSLFDDLHLQYICLVLLSGLGNYGLYILSCACWSKGYQALHLDGMILLFLLPAALLFLFYGILTPLLMMQAGWVHVVVQTAAALLAAAYGPVSIAWMYSLYEGNRTWKSFCSGCLAVLKRKAVWTGCCGILLLVFALDTLSGGVFSLSGGIHPYDILSALLFQANPLVTPIIWAILNNWALLFLSLVTAPFVAWLEVSVIHGTETA